MNGKRRWAWLVLLLASLTLAIAASGCGGGDDKEGGGTTPAGTETGGATGGEKISVGMVSDTGGLDDRGFNEHSIDGFERAQKELGVEGRVYASQSADDYLPNLTAAVDDGHDLVIAIGFLIQQSVVEVAKQAKDTNFAGVDQFYGEKPDCGGKDQSPCALPNVLGLVFPSEEAGYLAGVVAAMMTKSKTVSTVGGVSIPPVNNWIAGFQQAVKDTNPNVKTLNAYSQDFVDQAKCKEIALDQISQGSDVVFQVAGQCGLGALDAACEEGKYAIGVDADQSFAGDCVVTSALKPLELAVFETIRSAREGTFEGGTNRSFGIEEFPEAELLAPYNADVPQKVKDAVEEAKKKLASGEIDPPATLDEVQ
ncbi:MAG: BMP family ABC transporter substrate-binding protein [Actinomycetota bacterium]|nr:BMP family ABC transporter substrate-binding protein [Actinomycetota bacterium]